MEDDDNSSYQTYTSPVNDDDEREYLLVSSPPPSGTVKTTAVTVPKVRRFGNKLKRFLIFCSLWTAYLIISAAYSIISPFYPQEAARYNVGSLSVGLIVGSSPLCVVILSPILGYFIPEIGLKFMLVSGTVLVGGAFVLLGFLVDMSTRFEFILFSVLLRIVEGIGSALYSTSLFTIASILYPESTGTVMGILEVGSGLGFVAGPVIGAVLYNVGGFVLPFIVTGGLVLLFVPFFIFFLPNAAGKKQYIPPRTLLKLSSNVPFLVLSLDNVIMIAALGFFTPTFAPFLVDNFGLSELGIGLVFLSGPLFYMISSILAGKLSDVLGPRYFIVGGFLFTGISYFFVGPAYFISSESHLWIVIVAFCGIGIGLGFGIVPIFPDMLEIAKEMDPYTDQEVMNGIVSGLSSSTLCLGEFIGPIVGGALTEVLSFQMSALIFGEVLIAKGLFLLGITLINRYIIIKKTSTKYDRIIN